MSDEIYTSNSKGGLYRWQGCSLVDGKNHFVLLDVFDKSNMLIEPDLYNYTRVKSVWLDLVIDTDLNYWWFFNMLLLIQIIIQTVNDHDTSVSFSGLFGLVVLSTIVTISKKTVMKLFKWKYNNVGVLPSKG